MANGFLHAAERKTIKAVLDSQLNKAASQDPSEVLATISGLIDRFGGSNRTATMETIKASLRDKDSKWSRFLIRMLRNSDRNVLSMFLMNAGYEGAYSGGKTAKELEAKFGVDVPRVVLMDPEGLSYELMDRVISQAEDIGIHIIIFMGKEPLSKKEELMRLARSHAETAFHAFTGGYMVDEPFCRELLSVRNFLVSVEPSAIKAMDLLHDAGIPFGAAVLYDGDNFQQMTSDGFFDYLISRGCFFAWFLRDLPWNTPEQNGKPLTAEQRQYVAAKLRQIRGTYSDKDIFAVDILDLGEIYTGKRSGGKGYCHIDGNGDVGLFGLSHRTGANVKQKSLWDCILMCYNNMADL
ncbi:MAG: hypothetical protein K5774_07310 [Clostridia bacterium]|nr:hypothetical protein [Clostridia bacterium]